MILIYSINIINLGLIINNDLSYYKLDRNKSISGPS